MSEKPLHVQVAEALGWFGFEPSLNGLWPEEWRGRKPVPIIGEPVKLVPRYDTNWSATGPLIEKYEINLSSGNLVGSLIWTARSGGHSQPHLCPDKPGDDKRVFEMKPDHESVSRTPLAAVCFLILALKAAGKLEPSKAK